MTLRLSFSKIIPILLCVTIFASVALVGRDIYEKVVTPGTFFFYLASVFFVIYLLGKDKYLSFHHSREKVIIKRYDVYAILVLISIQLPILAYYSGFPLHYVQDEFIPAFISYSLPHLSRIDWFAGYPLSKDMWVSQFPLLFFILQKPFFYLFGHTLEAIRISTWPYHIVVVIYLFLFAKLFFNRSLYAFITTLLYILFAPNIYISSLGVHFVSSVCFFLVAFYYFILSLRAYTPLRATLAGIFTACCYLTYASSYIALPIFIMIWIIGWIRTTNKESLYAVITMFFVLLIIITPFILHAYFHNNYFLQRVEQVSNVSVSSGVSPQFYRKIVENFSPTIIQKNITSLYTDGTVGINDYWFGHLAPFTYVSLTLFVTGLLLSVRYMLWKKKIEYSYTLIAILLSFIFSMILTNPPGALHRFVLAFPFIAFIMSLPIISFLESPYFKKNHYIKYVLCIVMLVGFVVSNIERVTMMMEKDKNITVLGDSVLLSAYITTIPSSTPIYIAAFPAYHLERELFFRIPPTHTIKTDYVDHLVLSEGRENILIAQGPDQEVVKKIEEKYPDHKKITTINNKPLKNHLLFVIPSE